MSESRVHKDVSSKLSQIPNVNVRHLESLPTQSGHYDSKTEQKFWDEADTIVLEFPMYWYHSPSVLRQYIDDVLTDDWAYEGAYELEGKNLLVLTTTGGEKSEYNAVGEHGFTMSEILTPYKSLTKYTKMNYLPELVIYAANFLSVEELESQTSTIVEKIRALTK